MALRQLRRQKGYTVINLAGLTISLASVLLIFLYVADELSFDRFHADADRIHTIGRRFPESAPGSLSARITDLVFTYVRDELPEVDGATRITPAKGAVVRIGDRAYSEEGFVFADSNFLHVLNYPLAEGDVRSALDEPFKIVLSRSTADRYFGQEPALGRELIVEHGWIGEPRAFRVTAVVDVPDKTSFPFDGLLSAGSNARSNQQSFVYGFVRLRENTSSEALEQKLRSVTQKIAAHSSRDASPGEGIILRPLTSIHLGPHGEFEFAPASLGNRSYVLALSLIGVFVLILACINYVNLATARSATRAKEIGIRKVIGSDRSQLVRQHLTESLLLVFLALLLAVGTAQIFLAPYNSLIGKDMAFGLLTQWYGLPMLLGLGLFIGLLAGAYPAFYLTRYSPALILKGGETGGGRSTQRRLLVVFQFAISIALIATTALVYLQMRYTRSVDLGFDKEHVLVVSDAWRLQERRSLFENEVETLAGVSEAVYVGDYPGSDFTGTNDFSSDSTGSAENVSLLTTWVSEGLAETLGIDFIEGRDFSFNRPNDTRGIILNEAAVREFGFKEPLGRPLYLPQYRWVKGENTAGQWERTGVQTFEVIGVVRDFHHFSLQKEIPPLGILYAADEGMNLLVRFRPGDPEKAVSDVMSAWARVAPDLPFDYGWLDEQYDAAYRSDERFAVVASIFAGLAVLLACLGILGLASYTAFARRKEIGIRKVLGATAASIARLLTGDYVALILLAFVLAVPLAYVGMSRWLENYAFRIEIGPAPFLIAGFLALGFALAAVSIHAVRASLTDPVETLKYE